MDSRQPIYLLADSQLLFWKDPDGGAPLLDAVVRAGLAPSSTAAYVGASNGDAPEYFEIFKAAMETIGIASCCHIRSVFSPEDADNLARAEIVLLAGGDVERGWNVINATGMREVILQRHAAGATLIGVSAGAVHLGLDGFQLCPFVIGAHDEKRDWRDLGETVRTLGGRVTGLGIRSGGGAIGHVDGSIEAVRYPADELFWNGQEVVRAVLLPRTKKGAKVRSSD